MDQLLVVRQVILTITQYDIKRENKTRGELNTTVRETDSVTQTARNGRCDVHVPKV